MANDKTIQAAKKLRKALQIALSAVELEPDDVAELSGVFDPFDPTAKYKKGEIATSGGQTYICIKTVKGGADPANDTDHWQLLETGATDPGSGEQGGSGTAQVPDYDPDATYNKGDQVTFGGVVYTCDKNNVTGVEPGSDSKTWVAAE